MKKGWGIFFIILGFIIECAAFFSLCRDFSTAGTVVSSLGPIAFFLGLIFFGIGWGSYKGAVYDKEEAERLKREQEERAMRRQLGLPYIRKPIAPKYYYGYDVTVELPPISLDEFFMRYSTYISQFAGVPILTLMLVVSNQLRGGTGSEDSAPHDVEIGWYTFKEQGKTDREIKITANFDGRNIVFHFRPSITLGVAKGKKDLEAMSGHDPKKMLDATDTNLNNACLRVANKFWKRLHDARP